MVCVGNAITWSATLLLGQRYLIYMVQLYTLENVFGQMYRNLHRFTEGLDLNMICFFNFPFTWNNLYVDVLATPKVLRCQYFFVAFCFPTRICSLEPCTRSLPLPLYLSEVQLGPFEWKGLQVWKTKWITCGHPGMKHQPWKNPQFSKLKWGKHGLIIITMYKSLNIYVPHAGLKT